MSTTPKEHPALASAKRAIRRSLSRLTPVQVFQVAVLVNPSGHWGLTASYATS